MSFNIWLIFAELAGIEGKAYEYGILRTDISVDNYHHSLCDEGLACAKGNFLPPFVMPTHFSADIQCLMYQSFQEFLTRPFFVTISHVLMARSCTFHCSSIALDILFIHSADLLLFFLTKLVTSDVSKNR